MDEPREIDPLADEEAEAVDPDHPATEHEEVVDALPVLADPARVPERPQPAILARLAQVPPPALAAAGGFVLGVFTYLAVKVLRAPRKAAPILRVGRKKKKLEVAGSQSFLVDVHFLKK